MLRLLVLCVNFVIPGICFNLDVDHPIIIKNPDDLQNRSYFGYSVVLYSDGEHGEKWIKVGAPKATYGRGRKEEIQHSGIVYHCSYMERCQIQENLNYSSKSNFDMRGNLTNAWTGGSMDISYKHKTLAISASSWQVLTSYRGKYSVFLRGGMLVENIGKGTLEANSSLKYPSAYPSAVSFYSRAQSGFSLHFLQDENELLVGAPGVSNYLGTVFKIGNIDKKKSEWDLEIMSPQGNYYEYSGYALTSGCFYQPNQLYYVTGLPKGHQKQNSILYGSVSIFKFTNKKLQFASLYDVNIRAEFYGTQFGEYFGASLAAGDLNGDKLDDLIIGAPFRSNDKDGFNHGSVYVIYGNKIKLKQETKNRIDGTVTNGLLGSAVMFLGNLDNDGYGKFAVSAIQEETSGVVYIYTYDKLAKRLVISQRIVGGDIFSGLRGFGMSFSRPKDIDDNHFSDVVIGAPISGHAVLLRSKPTVLVRRIIKAPSTISKRSLTFSFDCCYSYSNYPEPTLSIIRNLTIDADRQPNRLYFEHLGSDKNSDEKEINMDGNKEHCEKINVSKVPGLSLDDYSDSISITLTYRFPENKTANTKNPIFISETEPIGNDAFCKTCPILSQKAQISETKHVMWDQLCNGQPCQSRLIVQAQFSNLSDENIFIIGSTDPLLLKVTVLNKGDPAFTPSLDIYLPNGVNLRRGPMNCEISELGKIICDLGDELIEEVTYNYELSIDEVLTETDLRFFFNSSTTTANLGHSNSFNLTLQLKKDADFEITGESKESSYIYTNGETTIIQNIFKIEKMGPSPMPEIEANIIVPYEMMDSKGIYRKFANVQEYQDGNIENQVPKCQNITEYHTNPSAKRLRREANITYSDGINSQNNTIYPMFNLNSVLYINCSLENIKCVVLKCLVGPFENIQKYAEINIEMKMNFEYLEDMFKSKDSIVITTGANISIENFTQSGNRSDFTEVTNLLTIEKEYKISMWILIGSAVAGLVILIFFSICLAKAGFFKRKDQEKLRQLKEEVLEEERLLEAMIDRELANANDSDLESPYLGNIRKKEPAKAFSREYAYGPLSMEM